MGELFGQQMKKDVHEIVSEGLTDCLTRLWRYGLVLSGNRDMTEDLVQATCVRALERASQYQQGTHIDRWLFTILSSIWKNELRSRKVRQGEGFVDAEIVLVEDGVKQAETNIYARQVLNEVQSLPEAQRTAVYLVYVEGQSYKEAAAILDVPIGTVMSRLAAARVKLGHLDETRSNTGADGDDRQQ